MSDPAFIFWFIVLSVLITGGLHFATKFDDSPGIGPFMKWRSVKDIEEEKSEA